MLKTNKMQINFLFLNKKLSVAYRGDILSALEYLNSQYGNIRIHSIIKRKGPNIIFKNLPPAEEVKKWCIKRRTYF